MPEGDIVARAARTLDGVLAGRRLVRAQLRWGSLGSVDLVGARVVENVSRGKHLLTRLDDGRTLHTHLRMEGRWRVLEAGSRSRLERSSDVRCLLATTEHVCLGLQLGMMHVVPTRDERRLVGHLGPDLLDPSLDVADAGRRLRSQGGRPIGEVLLDQRVVAGAGTIYVAETLWRLRIHPLAPAGSLGSGADDVVATAAALLARSVAAPHPTATGYGSRGGGSSPGGSGGLPQLSTYVHGREGRACLRCADAIAVLRVGRPPQDRPAFYCPTCQPDASVPRP